VGGWRSFLAVELGKELAGRIHAIQGTLKAKMEGVRWVGSGGVHVTLKFLGEIDPNVVDQIAEKAQEAVQGITSFTISIGGGGAFPNSRNPRVLWIGVDDHHGLLTELQDRVERKLEALGFQRENREYRPHLTLGRVRSGTRKGVSAEAMQELQQSDVGTMEVKEITLFRSDLKPTGAEYTKLRTIPLQTL